MAVLTFGVGTGQSATRHGGRPTAPLGGSRLGNVDRDIISGSFDSKQLNRQSRFYIISSIGPLSASTKFYGVASLKTFTMAKRATPSGIALDIRRKLDASYDIDGELNARLWIEDVTGILMDVPPPEIESLEQLNEWRINERPLGAREFARVLKDGIFLCKLINTLEPGTIKKIHEENLNRFKKMENIFNFIQAAKKWGVTEQDLFQTIDLYEERNMNQVLNGIYAVARKAQDRIPDDTFPKLGPKEAKYNPRQFTEEQMNRGKHICVLRF